MSDDIPICSKISLHSLYLLPQYQALKANLDALQIMSPPIFTKQPHLGLLQEGQEALEDTRELKFGGVNEYTPAHPGWDTDWQTKIRYGYEKLEQTLGPIAREFDVSGHDIILREKLTTKWCDCVRIRRTILVESVKERYEKTNTIAVSDHWENRESWMCERYTYMDGKPRKRKIFVRWTLILAEWIQRRPRTRILK